VYVQIIHLLHQNIIYMILITQYILTRIILISWNVLVSLFNLITFYRGKAVQMPKFIENAVEASYLDLYLEHDITGTLTTKLYDKRDDFNFPLVNYPFLDRNIPSSAYGVYMSQLSRYSRTCNSCQDFSTSICSVNKAASQLRFNIN